MSDKHLFALWVGNNHELQNNKVISLEDPLIIHRIVTVLRLKSHAQLILFNHLYHAYARIKSITKNTILMDLDRVSENRKLMPAIHVIIPLLKQEALEELFYACVELGATSITPCITQKSRSSLYPREFERLMKYMVAAAEQSKNFALPVVREIHTLAQLCTQSISGNSADYKLFFDHQGKSVHELVVKPSVYEYTLLIGPEGDLTTVEKELVQNAGFISYALTPTILRAQQALVVGLGIMRSLYNNDKL